VREVITAIGDETTGADVDDESTATADSTPSDVEPDTAEAAAKTPRASTGRWTRIGAYALLPGLALVLTVGAGYLKWQADSARAAAAAQSQAVAAATESTIALLSYRPDTADKELSAARDRLTGDFRDSYSALIHDVVIPGAQQKQISAVATVPSAGSVSATANHAVVLVFVDQAITIGNDPPTSSASSVKVSLEKIGERWLISDFTPV
jgi:Mce-associated membrane protein